MASPLSASDKAAIDKSLEQLKEAKAEIARAKLAGIDVSDQESQANELTKQLEQIKAAYFPRG